MRPHTSQTLVLLSTHMHVHTHTHTHTERERCCARLSCAPAQGAQAPLSLVWMSSSVVDTWYCITHTHTHTHMQTSELQCSFAVATDTVNVTYIRMYSNITCTHTQRPSHLSSRIIWTSSSVVYAWYCIRRTHFMTGGVWSVPETQGLSPCHFLARKVEVSGIGTVSNAHTHAHTHPCTNANIRPAVFISTIAHTHTHTHRERERQAPPSPLFVFSDCLDEQQCC